MAAENFDRYDYEMFISAWFTKIMCTENLKYFLKTFARNLEVHTMPKCVAFFIFAGKEFFKSRKAFSQKYFSFLLILSWYVRLTYLEIMVY